MEEARQHSAIEKAVAEKAATGDAATTGEAAAGKTAIGKTTVARADVREAGRRRLRSFAWHLGGYFLVMVTLVLLNLATGRGTPWFLVPMLGWGLPLALHAAWVMGLIGRRH